MRGAACGVTCESVPQAALLTPIGHPRKRPERHPKLRAIAAIWRFWWRILVSVYIIGHLSPIIERYCVLLTNIVYNRDPLEFEWRVMAQSFPINAWYAAAWDVDIKHALFPRTICGKHVVIYRQGNGEMPQQYWGP